jgi:putative Holliday junction resolvase
MVIMSVDFGEARTGLAVCDEGEILASPLCVVREKNFRRRAEAVAARAVSSGAGLIVVGHPKKMDGTKSEAAEKCERFSALVRELSGIPVALWDERVTTVLANTYLNEAEVRGRKRKAVVDAVAACIILEEYLTYRHSSTSKSVKSNIS